MFEYENVRPPRKQRHRAVVKMFRRAGLQNAVYTWVVIVAVILVAAGGYWDWAWLIIGLVALRGLLDGVVAITVAISGIMLQLGQADRCPEHGAFTGFCRGCFPEG